MLRAAPISLLLLAAATVARAQPDSVKAEWWHGGRTSTYWLERAGVNRYVKVVRAPDDAALRRVTLCHDEAGWVLTLEHRVPGVLGLRAVDGDGPKGERWRPLALVELERHGSELRTKDREWTVTLPSGFQLQDSDSHSDAQPRPAVPDRRPLVKVLITGFDKFPRPRNHPRYVAWDGEVGEQHLSINPSGWAVRAFDPSDLSDALRRDVRVEIHKCNDVPVKYVVGAKVVTDAIARFEPDVAISFGVGADFGADADVERHCENLMDDTFESVSDRGHGPFHLPADWPPKKPSEEWTTEEKAWMLRYPDNAGVSYNDQPIDPGAPGTLHSSLPVDRIVHAVEAKGLSAVDGGGGPGRYVCNNVMFRVIQAQARRHRLGGFVHMSRWSESRRQGYLTVVSVAIEESVRAFLEEQARTTLPGKPVLPGKPRAITAQAVEPPLQHEREHAAVPVVDESTMVGAPQTK